MLDLSSWRYSACPEAGLVVADELRPGVLGLADHEHVHLAGQLLRAQGRERAARHDQLPAAPEGVLRQNLVRLAQERPRSVLGASLKWGGRATGILRPAALPGQTESRWRMRGAGGQNWTCNARSVAASTGSAGLRRPPDVAMVQAADFWNRDDHAQVCWRDWPSVGGSVSSARGVRARW